MAVSQTNFHDDNATDLLSKGAEVFRSKLIADFHLLESINERGGKVEAPSYYTTDVIGKLAFHSSCFALWFCIPFNFRPREDGGNDGTPSSWISQISSLP